MRCTPRGIAVFVNRPSDAFRAPKVRSKDHLTEKPTELLRQLIEAMTVPGEMVADPFGGTASTLVAALELDRRAWGCELLDTNYNAGWGNIANAVKKKQSGEQPVIHGAQKIQRQRKPAAARRGQPPGRIGMSMMRSGAPEPATERSLEESVAAVEGAVTWGWTG